MWVKIDKIEQSQYNNNSYLAMFTLHDRERFVVVSKKVLEYLKTDSLKKGDEIFVMKSFNKTGDERFLIKKLKGEP